MPIIYIYIYKYMCVRVCVTRFTKTRHNDAFLEIHIFASVSSIYLTKALFCSNTNTVLQILFELQGKIAREAMH